MKIVKLTAENIKRIKAIEINPEGTLQIVAGRNGQGKSSVLDAIWYALGGGPAKKGTSRPIRDGETSAHVMLDLGDITVTRTWTSNEKSTLKVESADGASYKSPQSMLDGLVGKLSFDPLAFTHLSPKEQREALLGLVDLDTDLDVLERDRQTAYEERAEIGRHGKALGTVTVDDSLPTEEESATEIISRIRAAQAHNQALETVLANADDADSKVEQCKQEIASIESQLRVAKAKLDNAIQERFNFQEAATKLDPRIDTASLEESLSTVEDTNAKIRANNAEREKEEKAASLRAEYQTLTNAINDIDAEKEKALANAQFPVEGLGFDADGVTYQGIPFSQASSAEQIRVSLAMAMALNPKLRVIRIKDGSLLDGESMMQIEEMAAEHDFQIWIERVDENGTVGVLIEDGEVAA